MLGGALISMSLLLSGLAITVMTIKPEDKEDNNDNELQVY